MVRFLGWKNELIGIDACRDEARILQLRRVKGGMLSVRGASCIEHWQSCPPRTLSRALARGGCSGRNCIISLPREDLMLQSIRIPRMGDEDRESHLPWAAEERFGIPRNELVCVGLKTAAPAASGNKQDEVILLAVRRQTVEERLAPFIAAGLRPVAVETGCTALARYWGRHARRLSDRSRVSLVLEFGEHGSTILVLQGDAIAFVKQVEIGEYDLNAAVSEHLGVEPGEVRALRIDRARKNGTGAMDPAIDRAIYESSRPLLSDLVHEVVLSLRHYSVTFRGTPPGNIVMTGTGAMERDLAGMLQEATDLPTQIDDQEGTLQAIWSGIRDRIGPCMRQFPSWSVAAGLSLRTMSHLDPAGESVHEELARGAAA